MKRYFSSSDLAVEVHQTEHFGNHSTCKAWPVLLLFHTGAQLSFPNMVCLHFSVTHRSTVTPVVPPASNHRASPLWTARPGFQSCDSNPFQLNNTSSENSGVGGYLTGESNYNWRLNTRQTAGNLTLTIVHKKRPYRWEGLCWNGFSPSRSRQGGEVHKAMLTVTDNQFEDLCCTNPLVTQGHHHSWSVSNTAQLDTCGEYLHVTGGVASDCNGIGVAGTSPITWHSQIHCVV